MGKKKSAVKKKRRRMMQARRDNEAKISLEKERASYGGKLTFDELLDKTLHPYG
ncbi:hypothetical protein [Lacticaseibacillus sp. N501-2]|uniref:hypothetical protein n=1 Tax=Lacticaseibacillus salsurae TaxID=3367729 RepID=UPI0038B38666